MLDQMKSRGVLLFFCLAPLCVAQFPASPRVRGERIGQHLQALSEFGRNPQGGVSRVAYGEADLQARQYTLQLMREAGLEVGTDLAGNLVGRRTGSDPSLNPILIGSHIDSVPEGGNYDGDVGSMSAIEVAQVLSEQSAQLTPPLEFIVFQNEEGGTVGSHAISFGLDEKILGLVSQSGKNIREGTGSIGGDVSRLAE